MRGKDPAAYVVKTRAGNLIQWAAGGAVGELETVPVLEDFPLVLEASLIIWPHGVISSNQVSGVDVRLAIGRVFLLIMTPRQSSIQDRREGCR